MRRIHFLNTDETEKASTGAIKVYWRGQLYSSATGCVICQQLTAIMHHYLLRTHGLCRHSVFDIHNSVGQLRHFFLHLTYLSRIYIGSTAGQIKAHCFS